MMGIEEGETRPKSFALHDAMLYLFGLFVFTSHTSHMQTATRHMCTCVYCSAVCCTSVRFQKDVDLKLF